KLTRSLLNSYKVDQDLIEIETDIEDLKLDVDTIIPLGLILNELISNALKYAFEANTPGKISISMHVVDGFLQLKVSDNGKGLPESFSVEKSSTLGYKLIKSFSDKLEATLEINHEDGASVKMIIPYRKAA